MAEFTRKRLLLSLENESRLQEWSHLYGVSESELVRRAIDAYDPEGTRGSTANEQEREAAAFLDDLTTVLISARESIERTNERVNQTLMDLNDPARRIAIAQETRCEIAENPEWLDEVVKLMTGRDKGTGTADSS